MRAFSKELIMTPEVKLVGFKANIDAAFQRSDLRDDARGDDEEISKKDKSIIAIPDCQPPNAFGGSRQ